MDIRKHIEERGHEKGRREGRQERNKEVILNMLQEKVDISLIDF